MESVPNMEGRRRIADQLLRAVQWTSPTHAWCECPGVGHHTTATGKRACQVTIDSGGTTSKGKRAVPTITCVHSSCSAAVAASTRELRSLVGKLEVVRKPGAKPGQHRAGPTTGGGAQPPVFRAVRAETLTWTRVKESFNRLA